MSYGPIHVLTAEERLDSGNIDTFKSNTAEFLNAGGVGIVIDFGQTKFIDSIGLGTLVSILKSTAQLEMKVFLCALSPQVRQIFELTRFNQLFDIFENIEDAKASMS
jgi:anti-anti-sigma factor